MRRLLLATTFFASFTSLAHAQSVQTGSIGGMSYDLLPASGGCSAATPCSVVTYLGYQNETADNTKADLTSYFGGQYGFAQANPHTIVIAPVEIGPQDEANDWGGYDSVVTPEGTQVIAVVEGVEAQMGSAVDPANSWVTGGSLGGTGAENFAGRCGPDGTDPSCKGLFSGALAFASSDWAAVNNPAQIAALCGTPLMAVHGTADTNQSITYDQNLVQAINSNPACGNSATLVAEQGALHGVWGNQDGYPAGVGPGTPLGWLTAQIAAAAGATAPAPAQTQPATPSGGTPTVAAVTTAQQAAPTPAATLTATQPTPALAAATIKPGGGSVTDAQGHVWAITASGKITEDGRYVYGGGGTSAMAFVNGVVYGQDDGHGPLNAGGWFTISSTDPSAQQRWIVSPTPPGVSSPSSTSPTSATSPAVASSTPPTTTPSSVGDYVGLCTTGVPNSPASSGGFGVLDGQIYTPDGQPFIARGINIRNDQLNAAVSSGQLLSAFPGLNMVRLYFEGSFSDDLSSIQASINALTAQGIVVAIEDHTGISKAPYTGSQLAAEQAWYAKIASANKTNPYVWFGTFNEPGQGTNLPGIAAQEQATYNTIRGTGDNSPILMEEPSGGNPGLVGANAHGYDGSASMASGADYGSMTNIVWDLHYYGWVSKNSTSQATVNAALQGSASGASGIAGAQTIQSADGMVPVIIGEFGNSTTGGDIDPNGDQVIKAVTQSGLGYLAWGWDPDPTGDRLTNGGGALTGYGQQIATAIASGPGASSVCAVSAIPTAVTAPALASGSAAVTAPALTPAATAVTAPTLASAPLTIDQVAAMAVSGQ